VVSSIQENGYLRITPVGYGHWGAMFHQFMEGNEVKINAAKGSRLAVATIPSSHYEGLRLVREQSKNVHPWQETIIDAGCATASEVALNGIQLLDPVTTNKKPTIIGNEFIAAPAAGAKAATIALATVAKTLQQSTVNGTVTIAFTTLELINGKGLEDVVQAYGPFDQVVRFNRFLQGDSNSPEILSDKKLPFYTQLTQLVAPVVPFRHPSTVKPDWQEAALYELGLPATFVGTPVELIHVNSVQQLIKAWLEAVEKKEWPLPILQRNEIPAVPVSFQSFQKEEALLAKLVSLYGVSGAEKPVRELILSSLPRWARPITDANGNIILTFGKGKQHVVFVAHMDEVGYRVDTIRQDGRLVLGTKGGFFNSVWEGHTAIVHAGESEVPAIFQPRQDYATATLRSNGTLTPIVFAGFTSKQQALAAGISEGVSTVTMPKKLIRLSENKATARGFDDRVGCASLLLALKNIDPVNLPFTVTFVWSVEEETGLTGATYAAKNLKDAVIVYPIDTFVSSDDPIDPKIFGNCPLGNGTVVRMLESVNIAKREYLTYLQELATRNKIKIQYGMTAGGTDGQGFLKYDIPSVPLSWPGRYSHSPVEVMDFRDMNQLIRLIQAIMMDAGKRY
jgi:putative aminopeptidase FrvX